MSPRIGAPNLSGPGALLSSSPPQDTVVLAFATALDLVSGLATSSNAQYVPLTSSAACAGGRETLYPGYGALCELVRESDKPGHVEGFQCSKDCGLLKKVLVRCGVKRVRERPR